MSFGINTELPALETAHNSFINEQQKIAQNNDILNGTKDGLDYLLTATSMGAGAMGVTVPVAITIEITNKLLNKSLEFGISEMEKRSQEEASKLLAENLRKVSAKEAQEFNSLKNLPPEEALIKAEKMVDRWFPEDRMQSIPAESRAEGRSIMAHWVARAAIAKLAEYQSAQNIVNNTLSGDIAGAQKELYALGKTLKVFAYETRITLQKISDSQEMIAAGLSDMSMDVKKNGQKIEKVADDVNFLKEFAFSRMTANEQLEFLKKQMGKGPVSDEMSKKISILEHKVNFEDNYKKYFDGAKNLVLIAKNLGVASETVSTLMDGLTKVDKLKTGIEAITEGRYLAGIASISGLFGGGGNPEAARHQEIIARLDRILENQKLISEQIQTSFKIQVEMLTQLSNQLRHSTELLYTKMDKVHNDVLGNRFILAGIIQKGLISCESASLFLRDNNAKDVIKNANFRQHLTDCSLEYDRVFKRRDFATYFSSGVYKTASVKELFEADEMLFLDAIRLVRNEFDKGYVPSKSLKNPVENMFGLIQKMDEFDKTSEHASINGYVEDMGSISTRFFAPGVTKTLQKMLHLYPVLALWNSRISDHTQDSLNIKNIRDNAGAENVDTLNAALELVNISIQQENLMSGDLLLPIMYKKFVQIQTENTKCDSDPKAFARCLLQKNDVLRKNFIVFGLYKEFYDQKISLSSYRQGLRIPNDPNSLKRLLKNNWEINWNAEKKIYEIKVAGIVSPLPSADELTEGKIVHSNSLPLLLQTREELVHLIAETSINKNIASEQKNIIHSLFVK
ncbi:MAG: hypothetical protein HUU57_14125 [Bdellovibrio sp.]|nr:hypothetical protein [Bdellovibrio sp.]